MRLRCFTSAINRNRRCIVVCFHSGNLMVSSELWASGRHPRRNRDAARRVRSWWPPDGAARRPGHERTDNAPFVSVAASRSARRRPLRLALGLDLARCPSGVCEDPHSSGLMIPRCRTSPTAAPDYSHLGSARLSLRLTNSNASMSSNR
jgi:hypothetical protein